MFLVNKKSYLKKYQSRSYSKYMMVSTDSDTIIGIDIEPLFRYVNPCSIDLFVNDSDIYENLLYLWTKKEAAFKALSLKGESPKIKDIIIKKNSFQYQDQKGFFKVFLKNDHIISLAFFYKKGI